MVRLGDIHYAPVPYDDAPIAEDRRCIVVGTSASGRVCLLPNRGNPAAPALARFKPVLTILPSDPLQACAHGGKPRPFTKPSYFYVEKRVHLQQTAMEPCIASIGREIVESRILPELRKLAFQKYEARPADRRPDADRADVR